MSVPTNSSQGMNPISGGENYNSSGSSTRNGAHLQRVDNLSMDPALFEKLFLNPQTKVSGDLRQMFGVPTPIALVGFGVALTPLAACLMGWRGSDQTKLGAAELASYLWFGGLLLELASIGEFLLGNTFAFVLFGGYGAWFLTYGATLMPFYGATAAYAPTPTGNLTTDAAAGVVTPGFTASFGFEVVFMTVLTFVFLVCSFRVNLLFVLLLLGGLIAFALLSAALLVESEAIRMIGGAQLLQATDAAASLALLAKGEKRLSLALKLVTGGGGAFFGAAMIGWYLTLAIMLAVVDFPILLPVFDLSTLIKGKSEKEALKREKMEGSHGHQA